MRAIGFLLGVAYVIGGLMALGIAIRGDWGGSAAVVVTGRISLFALGLTGFWGGVVCFWCSARNEWGY